MYFQSKSLTLPLIGTLLAFAVQAQPKVTDQPTTASTVPHPVTNPSASLMLAGDWVPDNPHRINFENLPKVPSQHVVISDVRAEKGVNQHNYLIHHNGKFWIMWSDGPGIEDRVGQRVKYATSLDGLTWTKPMFLTPEPPNSGKDSPLFGTRTDKGFRHIARGFWQRNGELLALYSLDEAGDFFGPSLELRAFRLNKKKEIWEDAGIIFDNAINNFPPKKLPTGEWMMTRRTHDYAKTGVHFLIGGHPKIDQWQSVPVTGSNDGLTAEEPNWWVLPDNNLMALFRDNRRSGYLFRSFSTDNGRTWSKPVRTNYPDAQSKFSGVRLKDGRYVLVSNPKPNKRDPLAISISEDGQIFTKMFYLVGGRHVDYPHVIEHDGHLLIAFAGHKQTVEVLKVRLADLNAMKPVSQRD
ncbi:hypothetical protein GCM10027347_60770 [Larkinella harenae]